MDHCVLSPRPKAQVKLICAGQSDAGMDFSTRYADMNFCIAKGINTPGAVAPTIERLLAAGARNGREVGAYLLLTCIVDQTDAAAMAKWRHYVAGADEEALALYRGAIGDGQHAHGQRPPDRRRRRRHQPQLRHFHRLAGYGRAYARRAGGGSRCQGILLTLDDFREGLDRFGQEVVPRLHLPHAKVGGGLARCIVVIIDRAISRRVAADLQEGNTDDDRRQQA